VALESLRRSAPTNRRRAARKAITPLFVQGQTFKPLTIFDQEGREAAYEL
jgi:hypothetical protein